MKLYILNNGLYHECKDRYRTNYFDCVYKRSETEYFCSKCQFKFPRILDLLYRPLFIDKHFHGPYYYFSGKNISVIYSERLFNFQKAEILNI